MNISGNNIIGKSVSFGSASTIIQNKKAVDYSIIGQGATVINDLKIVGTYVRVPVICKQYTISNERDFYMKKIIQISAIDVSMDILLGELNKMSILEGYEVIGVCSKGRRKKIIENAGVKVFNINIERRIRIISNIKTVLDLRKFFLKEKPSIVHVHTPIASVLGRIAAKLAKVPIVIYTAHGFYFHENMNKTLFLICVAIEKYMGLFFTDYIFTQSQEDAEFAVKNKFIHKNKIMAIGNGVDVHEKFNIKNINNDEILKLEKNLNIKESDIIVSFIGRLVKEKGIIDLLEAFKLIKNKNIKLLLIGDLCQGDRDTTTIQNIKKSNDNIIMLGKRDDINKLLKISDIFCLPSYREGMPRSIIEAMAMENAVIATNIRGAREEVIENKTGFLVNVGAPQEITNAIERLVDDPSLLEYMKKQGRKRALKLYDEKKVVQKQLDVFENLLKSKGI
ncbi:MAG: glycosyltransferase [Sarcina sp.]